MKAIYVIGLVILVPVLLIVVPLLAVVSLPLIVTLAAVCVAYFILLASPVKQPVQRGKVAGTDTDGAAIYRNAAFNKLQTSPGNGITTCTSLYPTFNFRFFFFFFFFF